MANSNEYEVILRRLRDLESSGISRYHAINKIQKELTTLDISTRIRFEYDLLNREIQMARKSKAIDAGDKVARLNKLKQEVPLKYALTHERLVQLNSLINSIVHEQYGINSSERDKNEF